MSDGLGAKLVRRAVRDEQGGDGEDLLLHLEAVLLERRAGLHEIDDQIGEARQRSELHRALYVDDLDLDSAGGEVTGGDARILRGDARHAGELREGLAADTPCDDEPAPSDAEVDGVVRVELALHQHIATAYADVRRAVLDVRGDIVGLQQEEMNEMTIAEDRAPDERTILLIERLSERRASFARKAGLREKARDRPQRAPFGERDRQ